MTTDLMAGIATSQLLSDSVDDDDDDNDGDNDDDDDVAGYQAMMKELPTIVSMSGLLDGDFDELNEIESLLQVSPVSDDDDIEDAYLAAVDASEATEDAYVQAMVPNPIPTEGFTNGYEACVMASALDEDLGFPSVTLMSTIKDTDGSLISVNNPLFVRAPALDKRDHTAMEVGLVTPVPNNASQSPRKKAKTDKSLGTFKTQTPATVRTSLDGVNAPNPLLFGRQLKLPQESLFQTGTPETNKLKSKKLARKPKSSSTPPRASLSSLHHPAPNLIKADPPKLRKPAKFVVPEQINSYPVPTFVIQQMKSTRLPICKVIVRGKVETTLLVSPETAIARVSAPPRKKTQADSCSHSTGYVITNQTIPDSDSKKKESRTKSKKRTEKSPNSSSCSTKVGGVNKPARRTTSVKASFTDLVPMSSHAPPNAAEAVASEPTPPKVEKLMVANPLDNVPPSESHKVVMPLVVSPPTEVPTSKVDGLATTTTELSAPLAVVSCNSSAATANDIPDELTSHTHDSCIPENTKLPENLSASKPVTKEEKAQACRDRNRQHARNTRLRKKAYVEELKGSILDLVEKRDLELEKVKQEDSDKEKRRLTRRKVLSDFLELRGRNDREETNWLKLVKDPKMFQLTLPVTRFQIMVGSMASSLGGDEQVLVGVEEVMADAAYLASFLQTLGNPSEEKPLVSLLFQIDETPLLMDGSVAILSWKATSIGAVAQGAKAELLSLGTIKGIFCPESDKLISCGLLFDTGAIQAQLTTKPSHM